MLLWFYTNFPSEWRHVWRHQETNSRKFMCFFCQAEMFWCTIGLHLASTSMVHMPWKIVPLILAPYMAPLPCGAIHGAALWEAISRDRNIQIEFCFFPQVALGVYYLLEFLQTHQKFRQSPTQLLPRLVAFVSRPPPTSEVVSPNPELIFQIRLKSHKLDSHTFQEHFSE